MQRRLVDLALNGFAYAPSMPKFIVRNVVNFELVVPQMRIQLKPIGIITFLGFLIWGRKKTNDQTSS